MSEVAGLDIFASYTVPEGTAYKIGRTLMVHPMHFLAPTPARRRYATDRLRQIIGGRQRDGARRRGMAYRSRRATARSLVVALWRAERTAL